MNSYAKYVRSALECQTENQIIEANNLYAQISDKVPVGSYYKALERLNRRGDLVRLAKGLYYRPRKSRFGIVPMSEKDIIDYYINNSRGIIIGYRLYNHLGLTTQISKKTQILSSLVAGEQRTIENIHISNCNLPLTEKTVPIIETMDILQNYQHIEDINQAVLALYMKNFAANYSDSDCIFVLKNKKYKKSAIAFLASFLDYHGVKNSLHLFLSGLSNYKIPRMEEFYESAKP